MCFPFCMDCLLYVLVCQSALHPSHSSCMCLTLFAVANRSSHSNSHITHTEEEKVERGVRVSSGLVDSLGVSIQLSPLCTFHWAAFLPVFFGLTRALAPVLFFLYSCRVLSVGVLLKRRSPSFICSYSSDLLNKTSDSGSFPVTLATDGGLPLLVLLRQSSQSCHLQDRSLHRQSQQRSITFSHCIVKEVTDCNRTHSHPSLCT